MVLTHIPVDIEDKKCRLADLSAFFELENLKAEPTHSSEADGPKEVEKEEETEKNDSIEDLKPGKALIACI